jgi:hypothetical protein
MLADRGDTHKIMQDECRFRFRPNHHAAIRPKPTWPGLLKEQLEDRGLHRAF